MGIGENLKRIREEKKITQAELSKLIGVKQPFLCQVERGTKALSLPLACQIVKILDCSLYDIVEENKPA